MSKRLRVTEQMLRNEVAKIPYAKIVGKRDSIPFSYNLKNTKTGELFFKEYSSHQELYLKVLEKIKEIINEK